MTARELYEYAKLKECEDNNIIIRLNLNGCTIDFDEIKEEDLGINYCTEIIIDPTYD